MTPTATVRPSPYDSGAERPQERSPCRLASDLDRLSTAELVQVQRGTILRIREGLVDLRGDIDQAVAAIDRLTPRLRRLAGEVGRLAKAGRAGSPVPAAKPPTPAKAAVAAQKKQPGAREGILSALVRAGGWVRSSSAVSEAACDRCYAARCLRGLVLDGLAEHNGRRSRASRWRATAEGRAVAAREAT